MKKVYQILAVLMLLCGVALGQNSNNVLLANGMTGRAVKPIAKPFAHTAKHEKNGPNPFWIDIDSADSFNQASLGIGYSRFAWELNSHYTADTNKNTAVYVLMDTVVDSYNSGGPLGYSHNIYTSLFLDSLALWCGQENNSGIDDTLIISVLGVLHPSAGLYNYPDTSLNPVTVYSRDTIFICPTCAFNTQYMNSYVLGIAVNHGLGLTLPTSGYTVKIEYWGSTLDSFMVVEGGPSFAGAGGCAGYTMADSSSYGPNSFHTNAGYHRTYPTTLDSVLWIDCNNNGVYDYGIDGADYIQNIGLYSRVNIGNTICNNLTIATTHTDASCNTCLNGTVSSNYSGGTSPYTFSWSNGATTQNITGLNPGTYSVTITDINNCTAVSSATVINSACGGFYATLNPTAALCATCADGWVSCSITGGTSPFTFNWSNGATSQNATLLLPGTYAVTITDNASCVLHYSSTIVNANVCSANFLLYPDTAAHTYWIVNQSYGTPVVHYNWNWGDNSPHDTTAYPTHTYSVAGNYTICLNITDGVGCSTSHCNSYYLQRTDNSMVTVYVIQATGIQEVSGSKYISIMPNPNDGNFTVSYHLTAPNAELRIMDITGRMLFKQIISGMEGKENINANLRPGIYYWQLMNDGKVMDKGKMAVIK